MDKVGWESLLRIVRCQYASFAGNHHTATQVSAGESLFVTCTEDPIPMREQQSIVSTAITVVLLMKGSQFSYKEWRFLQWHQAVITMSICDAEDQIYVDSNKHGE